MESRQQKQVIIGTVYALLAGLLVYSLIVWIRVEPTCFDNVQNGGEEGLDCGLVCGNTCDPAILALDVVETELLKVREGEYDVMARIRNDNLIYGAATVPYTILIQDAQGATLESATGTIYVLPAQTRYFVRTSLRVQGDATQADIVLGDVSWMKLNASDLKIDFPLRSESFTSGRTPGAAHEYEAIIANNSDFDFAEVDISVILRDADGQIVAVNATKVRTIPSRTDRYFKVTWPNTLGENLRAQVDATTNVFENSNFIKRYGTPEQFQEF